MNIDSLNELMPGSSGEVDDPIRKFQSRLKRYADAAESLRPTLRACQDAIQRAESKAGIAVGLKSHTTPKIEITLGCSNLDEMIPLFRELAKEGIKTDKEEPHKDHKVFDVIPMREYNLGSQVLMCVILFGDKKEEGKGCRMEQVGVKEVPVYEMKCD